MSPQDSPNGKHTPPDTEESTELIETPPKPTSPEKPINGTSGDSASSPLEMTNLNRVSNIDWEVYGALCAVIWSFNLLSINYILMGYPLIANTSTSFITSCRFFCGVIGVSCGYLAFFSKSFLSYNKQQALVFSVENLLKGVLRLGLIMCGWSGLMIFFKKISWQL